jgi:adenosylcobinamide amidohydrolase
LAAVGNHYASPPSWPTLHDLGLEKANKKTLALFGLKPQTSAFLYTGADMNNLVYAEKASDGFRVGVFATAGVKGNAMRAPVDSGDFVEPGTINLIILTNRQLFPPAMSRALITATEAKTAVLEDLDIRSSYTGTPATGTGTDSILVVAGKGPAVTMTGGHVKLGELMAKAVYEAVREAVAK